MAFDIQFKLIYQGIRDVFRVRSLSFQYWNASVNQHSPFLLKRKT